MVVILRNLMCKKQLTYILYYLLGISKIAGMKRPSNMENKNDDILGRKKKIV